MARLMAIVLLLLLVFPACAGAQQAVVVDRSGSMKPYYQEGLIATLSRTLVEALRAEGDVLFFAFSTTVTPLRTLQEIDSLPFGQSTYLDRPVDRFVSQNIPIAWMITDNIQDQPGDLEPGNTEVFYRKLRGNAVKRVTVFPIGQQPGRPGLVIYALLLDDAALSQYDKGMAGFQQRAKGIIKTDALRMKPLDKDTVQISFLRTNVDSKTSKILYDTGRPVREKLEIRFRSRFDHLEIADAGIRVVESKPSFGAGSLLVPERRGISISPQKVARLAAGDETEQVYVVDIDLGKLRLKRDMASLWRAAWGKSSEEAVIQLAFLIEVPQQNFQLRRQFLQNFHAASLSEAKATGKVYALNQLPRLMSEQLTSIRVESPLVFRVNYPWWPAFFWILLFLVGGGLIVLMVVGAGKINLKPAREWDVRATTDRGAPLEARCEKGEVIVQGDPLGTIDRNVFLPARGVALENGADRAPLSAGLELKIQMPRRAVILTFLEKKEAAQAAVACTPRRR
jgi:hypothetical protein